MALAFNDPKALGKQIQARNEERNRGVREADDPLVAMFRSSGHIVRKG